MPGFKLYSTAMALRTARLRPHSTAFWTNGSGKGAVQRQLKGSSWSLPTQWATPTAADRKIWPKHGEALEEKVENTLRSQADWCWSQLCSDKLLFAKDSNYFRLTIGQMAENELLLHVVNANWDIDINLLILTDHHRRGDNSNGGGRRWRYPHRIKASKYSKQMKELSS